MPLKEALLFQSDRRTTEEAVQGILFRSPVEFREAKEDRPRTKSYTIFASKKTTNCDVFSCVTATKFQYGKKK